jgi:ribosome-associated protein
MLTEIIAIHNTLSLPVAELSFRFARSGGPGGQHVNTTESKVILSFDVLNSPSLDEESRTRILAALASRIDSQGILHLSAQRFRSQHRNRADAIERLQALLADALIEQAERKPLRIPRAVKARRLHTKHHTAEKKNSRNWRWEE